MKRTIYTLCTAVCALFAVVSCSKSDDNNGNQGGGITNNNFSSEVTKVVPQDLIQKMAAGGATIYGGTNPPRVEGFFKTGGMLQLRHSTLGAQDPLINKIHDGFYYKFYQQNGAKLKMNYQNFNRGYGARGVDAVISGEGNKFTIFFINKQMDLSVNEALILQQVYEDGVDDVDSIVDQAGMPKKVTMNVLTELKSKGLLTVIQQTYGKIIVSVTSQGKKLVNTMWPEAITFAY